MGWVVIEKGVGNYYYFLFFANILLIHPTGQNNMFPHTSHVEKCVLLYSKEYYDKDIRGKKVTVEVGMNK